MKFTNLSFILAGMLSISIGFNLLVYSVNSAAIDKCEENLSRADTCVIKITAVVRERI